MSSPTEGKAETPSLKPLVVDAMVLISAVIGQGSRKILQELIDRVAFFAPEEAYAEAEEHLPKILTRRGASAEDAQRRIPRDPEDWPCVALALHLGCPIWTRDTDYFGCGLPVYTHETVRLYAP